MQEGILMAEPRTTQLFSELTRNEVGELAKDGLAILPVGATEQHGPHLPSGTDAFHAEWIARKAALSLADDLAVVVTPTVPFGQSQHHLPFGGTLSLSPATFEAVLRDLCRSLAACGFQRIFILNGHGGNHDIVQIVANEVALNHRINVGCGSWWLMAHQALVEAEVSDDAPGHAGVFETSIMLALRPELRARTNSGKRREARPQALLSYAIGVPYRLSRLVAIYRRLYR